MTPIAPLAVRPARAECLAQCACGQQLDLVQTGNCPRCGSIRR